MSGGLFYAILATSQTKVMPLFTATVFPPGDFHYDTEVHANNMWQAKSLIANRDGVDETNVSNCRQVDDEVSSSSSSGGSGDMGGYLALGAIVFGLWLIIEYWWIVIPVAVIGGIGWFLKD